MSKALLATTARHLWIDQHRKRVRMAPVMSIEDVRLVERSLDYVELRALVEWLTAHLSEKQMRMLLLAEVYRYTYQEIAEEMNCTVPAVKMVLHRSKRLLRTAGEEQAVRQDRLAEVEQWTRELMYSRTGSR
jgi:RNA polymerase sigma-70 factor (ECF subfamily)